MGHHFGMGSLLRTRMLGRSVLNLYPTTNYLKKVCILRQSQLPPARQMSFPLAQKRRLDEIGLAPNCVTCFFFTLPFSHFRSRKAKGDRGFQPRTLPVFQSFIPFRFVILAIYPSSSCKFRWVRTSLFTASFCNCIKE